MNLSLIILLLFIGTINVGCNPSSSDIIGVVDTRSAPPVSTPAPEVFNLKLIQGNDQYCALFYGGVWCWNIGDSNVPTQPLGLESEVTDISGNNDPWTAGYLLEVCAIKNGALYCWTGTDNPALVSGFESGVTKVSFGNLAAYVIKNGELFSKGDNSALQLAMSAATPSSATFISTGITGVTNVYGSYEIGCLTKADGTYCFGRNEEGQLGIGSIGGSSEIPIQLSGLSGDITFPVGGNDWDNICVLDNLSNTPHTPICWGRDPSLFSENPTFTSLYGTNVLKITNSVPGCGHFCAITSQYEVKCTNDGAFLPSDLWSPTFNGVASPKILDFSLDCDAKICTVASDGLYCGDKVLGVDKRSFPALETYLAKFSF